MDYLREQTLKFMKRQNRVITLEELSTHLRGIEDMPSFNDTILLELVRSMNQVELLRKSTKEADQQLKIREEFKQALLKIDRVKLYIEDTETVQVLEKLYEIIIDSGPAGITYAQLQQSIGSQLQKKLKLQINQISHYCRKLFNYGFILIEMRQHFKVAIAKRFKAAERRKMEKNEKVEKSERVETNCLEEAESSNFVLHHDIRLNIDYQRRHCLYFKELLFLQNLYVVLNSAESQQKEGLTLHEIYQRLNKLEEKKAIQRCFENLEKDGEIEKIAERQGKIFSYRYRSNQATLSHRVQKRLKQEEKSTHKEQKIEQHEIDDVQDQQQLLIRVVQAALDDLIQCIKERDKDFLKVLANSNAILASDTVFRYLNDLAIDPAKVEKGHRRKTQPSRQKFNRFATIVNLIFEKKRTKQIEIKKLVSAVECEANVGIIDGRTIQGICQVLERVGSFCYSLREKVLIASKECDRILYVHHTIECDHPLVQEGLIDLQTINPVTVKKAKTEREKSVQSSSPKRKVKAKRISKRLLTKMRDILSSLVSVKEQVFHSESDERKPAFATKIEPKDYHCIAMVAALRAYERGLLKTCFKWVKRVSKEKAEPLEEDTIIMQLCRHIEDQVRNPPAQHFNGQTEDSQTPRFRKWDDIDEDVHHRLIEWEAQIFHQKQEC